MKIFCTKKTYEPAKKGGAYICGFSLFDNKNCYFSNGHNFAQKGPLCMLVV